MAPPTLFAMAAVGSVLIAAFVFGNANYRATVDFLYRWQTLVAGVLALIGAFATIWQMRVAASANERAAMETFERLATDMLKNLDAAWFALDHGEQEAVITGMPLSSFNMVWKDIESRIPWHLIEQSAEANQFYARVRCLELIEQIKRYIDEINTTRVKGPWTDAEKAIAIRTYFSHIDQAAKNFDPTLRAIFANRKKNKVDWTPYRETVADFLANFQPPKSLITRMREERRRNAPPE